MVLPLLDPERPPCELAPDMLADELPQIKENVRKGFLETQTKVNRWITDFRKKLDGDDNDDPYEGPTRQDSPPRRQNYGPSQSEQLYGIRRSADVSRKSTDKDRYDLDNRMLDDDFTSLELRDDEGVSRRSFRQQYKR
jgi:hypothetical protein